MAAAASHIHVRRLRPPHLLLQLLLSVTVILSIIAPSTILFADAAQLTLDACAHSSDCFLDRRCIAIDEILSLLDISTSTSSASVTPFPVSALASIAMNGTPCDQSSAGNCTCLPHTLSLCTSSAQCETQGERCVRFPGLLLDDAVCVSCTAMDYVTRVPVDVAGVACSTMPEPSMVPEDDDEGRNTMMMMSHEPDEQYDADDVMASASADSTMMYDTLPHAMYTPLMNDGAPLVLASYTPYPAASEASDDAEYGVDSTMASTVAPVMMDTPMPSSFEQEQTTPQASASSSYMNNNDPGPTMFMDNTMTDVPLALDDGDNQAGWIGDLIQDDKTPTVSVMPMASSSSEEDAMSMTMAATAAATEEAYTDGVTGSGDVMSSYAAMYTMSAEPSSMLHAEAEDDDDKEEKDDMMMPQASTMPWYIEPTVTPMTSYYYSYSFSASPPPPPEGLEHPTPSQMATPAPSSDYDFDMTPISSSSDPTGLLPDSQPTTTMVTSMTGIPFMTVVSTASSTFAFTVSATVIFTITAHPDVSATATATTTTTTKPTTKETTSLVVTVKMTMVPTTKVTTIPGGGESGNSLPSFPMVAMPSVSPEMSAVPTPEMEGEPKMTMEAESKGKDYEGEMTNVAVESNANDDGLVMKSPEVEMTKAYEMMMESYMTVTAAAAETDRPKQYAEEETEEMMPSPNTYSSVEDGDTTTTTTITSANNSSTNNIDEDDMATVSLTDASSPTSSNTDLILPSSSPSPEYLDDLLDDVDDATETHSEPTSNTSSAGDDTPLITPEPDEEVCIDARLLAHLPASDLVYGDKHRRAAVLCDDTGSCATPGHMVRFHGQAMSMRTYCKTNGAVARCVRRVALVNSPRYGLGVKVASKTSGLEFSVHAARFATGMEEWILRTVMRMGL